MNATNAELAGMLRSLQVPLTKRGMLGYAAAVNTNRLNGLLREYLAERDRSLAEFGENDGAAWYITRESEGWDAYSAHMAQFDRLTQHFDPMTVTPDQAMDDLTGGEMLAIGWMLTVPPEPAQ